MSRKITMPISVQWAFNRLVREIMAYESDTFSAIGNRIKLSEAETIAARFIKIDIEYRVQTNTMDGVMIQEEIDRIRRKDRY